MSATSPICSISAESWSISLARLNPRFTISPSCVTSSTIFRAWTFVQSAPAASNRGRIVSAMASSSDSKMTDPCGALPPPTGQRAPLLTADASAIVIRLLPSPGSPEISVSLPLAIFSGHSQLIGLGSTSATRTVFNFVPGRLTDNFFTSASRCVIENPWVGAIQKRLADRNNGTRASL